MTSFFLVTAALCLVAAATGYLVSRLASQLDPLRFRRIYLVLVFLSAVPMLLHARWTWRYSVGWIDLESSAGPVGPWPGAMAFAAASVLLVLALGITTAWTARWWIRAAGIFPALLFVAYLRLALPLMTWRSPADGVILDSMPTAWLFGWSAIVTAFLLTMPPGGDPASEEGRLFAS